MSEQEPRSRVAVALDDLEDALREAQEALRGPSRPSLSLVSTEEEAEDA